MRRPIPQPGDVVTLKAWTVFPCEQAVVLGIHDDYAHLQFVAEPQTCVTYDRHAFTLTATFRTGAP